MSEQAKCREKLELRCRAGREEKVLLNFEPCSSADPAMPWSAWHSYPQPISVYQTDYQKYLLPYLQMLFPMNDPISGERQEKFEVCYDNWIPGAKWRRLMGEIRDRLYLNSEEEREFYTTFLDWLERALTDTDIIVVEGNQ